MRAGYLIFAACVAIVALPAVGCASYTFKCAKSVSWALTPDKNPATLTGMCDGKKTVVLEGPGPGDVQHLCDPGMIHWWKGGDKLTCIPDPCAPGVTIFTPDGGMACGNQ